MSDHIQIIADVEVSLEKAEASAECIIKWMIDIHAIAPPPIASEEHYAVYSPRDYEIVSETWAGYDLHGLCSNEFEIHIDRQVTHTFQSEFELRCPNCQKDGSDGKWSDAISEWHDERGIGMLKCVHCGNAQPVTEWTFDPEWGFGFLSFQFWNWPPLKKSFIKEFTERLGHKTVYIADKF
jgi:hypothetical protein